MQTAGLGQEIFQVARGEARFVSEAPVASITAINQQAYGMIDLASGIVNIEFQMRGFQFKNPLMQEHFNTDFVHSGQFPTASFSGLLSRRKTCLEDWQGEQAIEAEGYLYLHGQSRKMKVSGVFSTRDNTLFARAVFPLTLADFNVYIPGILRPKIAPVVEIAVELACVPFLKP